MAETAVTSDTTLPPLADVFTNLIEMRNAIITEDDRTKYAERYNSIFEGLKPLFSWPGVAEYEAEINAKLNSHLVYRLARKINDINQEDKEKLRTLLHDRLQKEYGQDWKENCTTKSVDQILALPTPIEPSMVDFLDLLVRDLLHVD